jgi:hypothetical protein
LISAPGLESEKLNLVRFSDNDTCTMEATMNDKQELLNTLMDAIGEEGCGISCEEATLYKDEDGWQMMLEGFMAPWNLGQTVQEAKASIREYASMGFGLS